MDFIGLVIVIGIIIIFAKLAKLAAKIVVPAVGIAAAIYFVANILPGI